MKKWLIRTVLFVVVLELVYLGVVNLALNLPLTQTLINRSKPERFAVQWDGGVPSKRNLLAVGAA